MKILVIVVNYNNSHEIDGFLLKLVKLHPLNDTIIVDDGSTDDSPLIAKNLGFSRQGKTRYSPQHKR